MVSKLGAHSTIAVVTVDRVQHEGNLLRSQFSGNIHRLGECLGAIVHCRLCISLMEEVQLTVRWKVGLGAHLV
jgi:hypothetical protein